MEEIYKAKAIEQGLCCDSCQEDVGVHSCAKCGKRFEDGDTIYCKPHSQTDSDHYHEDCKPKEKEVKPNSSHK